jgi:alginate biosynthesis protein Alg44
MNQSFPPPSPPIAQPQPRIVHEAETQRQHVRIQMPISIDVGGTVFDVPDWSVGGIAIRNLEPQRSVETIFDGRLLFPLQGFDFAIPVRCEVRHLTNGITGCRFIDVMPSQIAFLQYLVGAYLSGELVSSGDVLSINARNNFAPQRKSPAKAPGLTQRAVGAIRRLVAAAIFALLGLGLIGYVAAAVYQRLYVSSFEGYVGTAASSYVRAPSDGVIETLPLKAMDQVKHNAVVGTLADPEGHTQNLLADCDCVVVATPAPQGSVVQRGSPVAVLASADSSLLFVVRAPSRRATGLAIGNRAVIAMFNGEASTGGTVVGIERYTPIDYSTERGAPSLESYVVILIKPDRNYTLADYGEPIQVRIDQLQLFMRQTPNP